MLNVLPLILLSNPTLLSSLFLRELSSANLEKLTTSTLMGLYQLCLMP